jgi:hypothetical protein
MTKSIRFKAGMTVKINSEYTGISGLGAYPQSLDQFDYKKGDHVELLKYDSADETWNVKAKGKVSIWVKRKNLAPIEVKAQPIPSPFKVGDKVELIAPTADWASNDNVTTGVTYTVTDVTIASAGQPKPYIKVSGRSARGVYWIECKNFKLYKQPKATPKVIQAVCINPGSYNSRITKGQIYNVQEAPSIGGDKFFKVLNPNDGKDSFNCWQDRFKVITEQVTETPKTVVPKAEETKKPRLMLCINMAGNSAADYTVGKVYELSKEDEQYYYFKASDDGGVGGGGMFKHRFIELKDGVENSVKVLCTNNAAVMDDLLTVGKTYEAVPSKDGEDFWTIPVSDKGTRATAYKHRFTVLTEEAPKEETPKPRIVYCIDNKMSYAARVLTIGKAYEVLKDDTGTFWILNDKGVQDYYSSTRFSDTNPKREWKVGDTLLSSFLNDPNIEKEFHGYDKGWNKYSSRMFASDRTVEVITEREGKTAARISGTMDIWITLESLEKHP